MSVSHGPTPRPPNDRSFEQAQQDAQRDFAWLFREHEIHWEIDLFTSKGRYLCGCDNRPRSHQELDDHIRGTVLKARVPPRTKR